MTKASIYKYRIAKALYKRGLVSKRTYWKYVFEVNDNFVIR